MYLKHQNQADKIFFNYGFLRHTHSYAKTDMARSWRGARPSISNCKPPTYPDTHCPAPMYANTRNAEYVNMSTELLCDWMSTALFSLLFSSLEPCH